MGRIIEGYWDCAYCGAKGILGRYRDCPSCGKPRGEDTVFYHDPPNEQNVVENPEEVSREADWHCEFCDSLNPASAKFCESCGSPRTDKTYFEMKEYYTMKFLLMMLIWFQAITMILMIRQEHRLAKIQMNRSFLIVSDLSR